MKNKNLEEFKKNLEEQCFSLEFIKKALNYFNELEEEMKAQELKNIEEVIDYFSKIGSFTCNTLQSEINLKELRKDLFSLYERDSNVYLDFHTYFENIEVFEIYLLYLLYFEFYPKEEDEEK